ncbi:MAG: hypothetical protein AUJ41_04900 [Candidatus Pacebacteria bacterium CG1_02_43_31]|nr:MAG: hypothetical protein AUJ41_04900 [Candidatus Pacebacteria bacterium CG1_02_43_31]
MQNNENYLRRAQEAQDTQRTTEIEGKLKNILSAITDVYRFQNNSSGDFKVNFQVNSDLPDHPTRNYNIKYVPDKKKLIVYAQESDPSLPDEIREKIGHYSLPDEIREKIGQKFPKASYSLLSDSKERAFHCWSNVEEADLE